MKRFKTFPCHVQYIAYELMITLSDQTCSEKKLSLICPWNIIQRYEQTCLSGQWWQFHLQHSNSNDSQHWCRWNSLQPKYQSSQYPLFRHKPKTKIVNGRFLHQLIFKYTTITWILCMLKHVLFIWFQLKKVEQYRTKWMALASADISSTRNSYMLRYLFYKGNVSLQQSNNKQAFLMLPWHLTINNWVLILHQKHPQCHLQ